MDFATINWLGVALATVAAFGLGGIWYGPVFGAAWMRLVGFTEEDLKDANMVATYGTTFVLQLIAVLVLTVLISPDATAGSGALTGLGIGSAWVATAMGVTYLFESKPFGLYLINAGYQVTYYTIAGAILGVF
ncbi:MAG: DUF1761 domain-containing protein [Bacteroidota bacterium]